MGSSVVSLIPNFEMVGLGVGRWYPSSQPTLGDFGGAAVTTQSHRLFCTLFFLSYGFIVLLCF